MKLNEDLLEAFSGLFLSSNYDTPSPVPGFHKEVWKKYTSDLKQVACAAPRNHAKTTAFSIAYPLASFLFEDARYGIIISSVESKAKELLSNITNFLQPGEILWKEFDLAEFEVEQKTEIIVRKKSGFTFKLTAMGAEQKIRGALWNNTRPDLIICDDMEDDEQVASIERRITFAKNFSSAVMPALAKNGRIRVHGTILHEDSLLANFLRSPSWNGLFYKAHKSYSDFSNLLWPGRWTEEDLRSLQKDFESRGLSSVYSQEYLNTPLDSGDRYLDPEKFKPIEDKDFNLKRKYFVGVDFAASTKNQANKTSFTIGSLTTEDGVFIEDNLADRMDSFQVLDAFFDIAETYPKIECFFVESGAIWLVLEPQLRKEMARRNKILPIMALVPVKSKDVRGRTYQRYHNSGLVKYDTNSSWFEPFRIEVLSFTGKGEAKEDDRFDSTATLFLGMEKVSLVLEEDFQTKEEEEFEYTRYSYLQSTGRSAITGY